jgi:ankyrin repeat protein
LVSRIKDVYSSSTRHPTLDVNARSKEGDTLLRLCVSSFHLEEEDPHAQLDLVRFLLDKGADPNLEDALGETALDWLLDQSSCYYDFERSLTRHQVAMVRLLVDRGARVYRIDGQGRRFGLRDCNIAVHPRSSTTLRTLSWNAGRVRLPPPRSSSSCTQWNQSLTRALTARRMDSSLTY